MGSISELEHVCVAWRKCVRKVMFLPYRTHLHLGFFVATSRSLLLCCNSCSLSTWGYPITTTIGKPNALLTNPWIRRHQQAPTDFQTILPSVFSSWITSHTYLSFYVDAPSYATTCLHHTCSPGTIIPAFGLASTTLPCLRDDNSPCLTGTAPCVAQCLERPLGAWEAGVRSPTSAHQRRKNWKVCTSQLGAWHQWVRQPTGRLGVSIMVWMIHFCSSVAELSRWLGTPKLSGVDRSAQTRQVQIYSPQLHPVTPACTTESNLQSMIWPWVVKFQFNPPPPLPNPCRRVNYMSLYPFVK